MQFTVLGRTGLKVSVAGLGCGGAARLGQSYGHSKAQSVALVRTAMDTGINFIDTATFYETEEIVGEAIRGHRDDVVISTKLGVVGRKWPVLGQGIRNRAEFARSVESNLRRLGTDYIDILHLHGVMVGEYDRSFEKIVPALERLRDQGKVRFFGLTEKFGQDTDHKTLRRAAADDIWDVVMVGHNMLNPSAREMVLKPAQAENIGVLGMFAVRRVLNNLETANALVLELIAKGEVDADGIDLTNPLGFLVADGVAESLTEAAYRFCRHEAGMHVVLTGTGSEEHLRANIAAIQKPPLPQPVLDKLKQIFGSVTSVSGN